MKRYVNCCDDGRDDSIHTTAKGARDYANKWGGYYAVAVEIELPDPPHEKTRTDRLTDIARRCEIARSEDRDVWHAFDLIEDLAMTLAEDGAS